MVSLHGVASCVVNVRSYAVSDLEYAARYSAEVNVYAVGLLCVVDSENSAVLVDSTFCKTVKDLYFLYFSQKRIFHILPENHL